MTKSYTSIAIESDIAAIVQKESKRNKLTITEQIVDYRNKSISLEEKVDELREQMKEMIKTGVN